MPTTIAPPEDLQGRLGAPDRRFSAVYTQLAPRRYLRTSRWGSTPDSLMPPEYLEIDVGGHSLWLRNHPTIALNDAANWDEPSLAVPANRAGKDFYVFSTAKGKLILSGNATIPTGDEYTPRSTRKIGGFHCLCVDAGTIENHPLSGMLAGEILPATVWDLHHRPSAEPEGMAYHDQTGKWYQIYLTDARGGSTFQGVIADSDSAEPILNYPLGSWYWFNELLSRRNMRLIWDFEFQLISRGSNTRTAIDIAWIPHTTGGHVDSTGRRMISEIGLEDCCGAIYQVLADSMSGYGNEEYGADHSGGNGVHTGNGLVMLAGGHGADGDKCGPSYRYAIFQRWNGHWYVGGRGCSEPLTSIQ